MFCRLFSPQDDLRSLVEEVATLSDDLFLVCRKIGIRLDAGNIFSALPLDAAHVCCLQCFLKCSGSQ